MKDWFYSDFESLLHIGLSTLGIYISVIVFTRIFGKRSLSKMSSFDFASTIAIGSILASIILSTDQSLLKGLFALAGIVTFQSLFALAIRKSNKLQSWFTNKPQLLMLRGEIIYANLDKCNVGEDDLIAKLREANVIKFDQVLAVVLESTGDMSVLHTSDDIELESRLLKGVAEL